MFKGILAGTQPVPCSPRAAQRSESRSHAAPWPAHFTGCPFTAETLEKQLPEEAWGSSDGQTDAFSAVSHCSAEALAGKIR